MILPQEYFLTMEIAESKYIPLMIVEYNGLAGY